MQRKKMTNHSVINEMQVLINKNFFYGFLAVCTLIFPSQLALNSPWRIAVELGVVIFVGLGVLLSLQSNRGVPRRGVPRTALPVFILLVALLFTSVFSSYLNSWSRPFESYAAFTITIIISFFLIGGLSNPTLFVKVIIIGTTITSMILLCASLTIEPISLYRYQGIFNNPNSMGWFTAGVCTLLIGALYENRLSWSRIQKKFLWVVLMGHLFFLFACNSRAAFLAVLVVVLLFLMFRFVDAVTIKRIRLSNLRKFNVLLFFLFVFGCGFYFAGFLDPIVKKFIVKSSRGDISADRLFIWMISLSHWTWFGLGPEYAVALDLVGKPTGHSTYINQLTTFGLIPSLLFVAILFYIWFIAFYSIRSNRSSVAPTLIATLTGFLVNAAFETGSATPGIWLTILLFTALVAESRIQQKSSVSSMNRRKFKKVTLKSK